jgi:hypothetical protein
MDPRNLGSVLHNPVDLSQKPCNGHKVSTPRAFGFRPKSRRLGTTTNPVSNVIAAAIHVRGFALRRDHHPVLEALFFEKPSDAWPRRVFTEPAVTYTRVV